LLLPAGRYIWLCPPLRGEPEKEATVQLRDGRFNLPGTMLAWEDAQLVQAGKESRKMFLDMFAIHDVWESLEEKRREERQFYPGS